MVKTQYALCAKRIILDSQENSLSAIDIIEEINSSSFPVILPRLSVIWTLQKDDEDAQIHNGSIEFSRNGKQLQVFPVEINFQSTNRTRCVVVIGGMPIDQPGDINVSFIRNGVEETTYVFPVISTPEVLPLSGK